MLVTAQVTIRASRDAVWRAITDVENAARLIRGIEKIEIVERPAAGLAGLRWKETRILFDTPATVEKWITESSERESYRTRAQDGGFVFLTTRRISEDAGAITLTESHESLPQTWAARLMTIPMRLFFMGKIRKAVLQDLDDIKTAAEGE